MPIVDPRRGAAGALTLAALLCIAGAGRDGFEEARAAFLAAVAAKDADLALDALEKLRLHDRKEMAELVIEYGLPHADLDVHRESEALLRGLEDPGAQGAVIEAAKRDKSWQLRADCTRIISAYLTEASYAALVELLADKRWLVRSEAIRGISQIREKRSVEALLARMPEERGRVLDDITDALRRLTGQSMPADPARWRSWWDEFGQKLDLPPENAEEGAEREKLGTAVKKGLYGNVVSERVVFVLDISGSMTAGTDLEGTRFDIATRELVRVLEGQLHAKSEFNILVFADTVLAFRPKLVAGKGGNIEKAIEFIGKLRAGGETNAYKALELAFADPEIDTIYLLSDGSPTVGEQTIPALIRRQVDEWNRYRGVKIHCIGFFPGEARHQDEAEARTFLRDLASENRGRYTEIE